MSRMAELRGLQSFTHAITRTNMRHKLSSLVVTLFCFSSVTAADADVLFGVIAGDATSGALAGHLVTIDPLTGLGTDLGEPIAGVGLTGLVVDSAGRLLASTNTNGGPPRLIEIDPATGALVSVIATLTFGGLNQPVTDLAFDPTTNTLYGNNAFGPAGANDGLLSIDMSTGVTTLVGNSGTEGGFKALASSDGGTLYSISTFGQFLHSLDPADASVLASIGLGPASDIGALGMTVATDGRVFFTDGSSSDGDGFGRNLWVIDPVSGTTTSIGSIGLNANVQDLAFLPVAAPEPTTLALWAVFGLVGGAYRYGKRKHRPE